MNALHNKIVLITGGTGSLGKAFTRHALDRGARKVIIFSRDEFKQSVMQDEVQDERMRYFVGDVRDVNRLRWAFKPADIVIHAAAMKQVPSCEFNPTEAKQTNVDGAQNVIDASRGTQIQRVVFISSDKAVEPVNLYGQTKAVAERMFLAANVLNPIFSCTRWGNIEGSRGSVIPFFRRKAVLPVTDMAMTRFVVTFPEIFPVIEAAIDYPPGLIWVRKSHSMRIGELVLAFDKEWDEVGMRQGEKLHETLVSRYEFERAFDVGEAIYIRPHTPFNTEIDYDLGGIPLQGAYSSDSNAFLSVEELKKRIQNVN